MRGKPVSRKLRKIDAVLLAAQWPVGSDAPLALRVVERRGFVWSDYLHLTPEELARRIEDGEKIYFGRKQELAGDYELLDAVQVVNGELQIGSRSLTRDQSLLPIF